MISQDQPEIIEIMPEENTVIVIESLCARCFNNGETRMLLTDIPFFKAIIVTSFSCPHCMYRNSEVQSAGQLAEFGYDLVLKITSKEDLQRDVVRGEWATTYIPELELEIPATKRGCMSTVEGFLVGFKEDLMQD